MRISVEKPSLAPVASPVHSCDGTAAARPGGGVAGPERRVDSLVAVGGAERAAALLHLGPHEVADRGAERGPLQVRPLRVHEARVGFPEACDGKVAGPALLADHLMQKVRVLRAGPDLPRALDQDA